MALIKCPECGKEISDKSSACIHCGYPITDTAKKQNTVSSITSSDDGQKQSEVEKYVLLGDDLRIAEKYPDALDRYIKAADLGSAHAQLWIGNFGSIIKVGVYPDRYEKKYRHICRNLIK